MADPLYVPLPTGGRKNALNLSDDEWDQRERAFEDMRRTSPAAADRVFGPNMRPLPLNKLAQGWNMPEYTVADGSGRVPMFAGPNALAPSMDRESTNYSFPDLSDKVLAALKQIPMRRINSVKAIGRAIEGYLYPPTMQDIGNLLPKQPIPNLSPESDAARAERERQYYEGAAGTRGPLELTVYP